MSTTPQQFRAPFRPRFERVLHVRLFSTSEGGRELGAGSQTINISEHGILVEVPGRLDACVGVELIVALTWNGGTFRSRAEIVRFESPYWRDPSKTVMGLRIDDPLPAELLKPR